MNTKKYFGYLLWALFLFLGLQACRKEQEGSPKMEISSLLPAFGPYSTPVTIRGNGFSLNPNENIVKFNGINASVQQATTTQLVVEVPKGAGTGPVTIGVNGKIFAAGIFQYIPSATVSTFAGSGQVGVIDGIGLEAWFYGLHTLAFDASGNLFLAAGGNIRKITPDASVSTLAGTPYPGFADGIGNKALFRDNRGVTTDAQGNVYVADTGNSRIRKITPTGVVSTLTGMAGNGFADGPLGTAQFFQPWGIVRDVEGNFYVADRGNNLIRKITSTGIVSTLAGSGQPGFADGLGTAAQFNSLKGIAIDKQGNLYVADQNNNRVRKVTPAGLVSTLAGATTPGFTDGSAPALLDGPVGIATDGQGNVYVADTNNHSIRKITPSGVLSTIAGNGKPGYSDGMAFTAQFKYPLGVAVDEQGKNIYVVDASNVRIRKITLEGF